MLVLTRKKNESILIDGEISISVIEVRGNRVKLGITAPDHVRVVRTEIVQRPEPLNRRCAEPLVGAGTAVAALM